MHSAGSCGSASVGEAAFVAKIVHPAIFFIFSDEAMGGLQFLKFFL
jgi:hypothetical protein